MGISVQIKSDENSQGTKIKTKRNFEGSKIYTELIIYKDADIKTIIGDIQTHSDNYKSRLEDHPNLLVIKLRHNLTRHVTIHQFSKSLIMVKNVCIFEVFFKILQIHLCPFLPNLAR